MPFHNWYEKIITCFYLSREVGPHSPLFQIKIFFRSIPFRWNFIRSKPTNRQTMIIAQWIMGLILGLVCPFNKLILIFCCLYMYFIHGFVCDALFATESERHNATERNCKRIVCCRCRCRCCSKNTNLSESTYLYFLFLPLPSLLSCDYRFNLYL